MSSYRIERMYSLQLSSDQAEVLVFHAGYIVATWSPLKGLRGKESKALALLDHERAQLADLCLAHAQGGRDD